MTMDESTRHTPTRQVQPFQRQLPIERDIKMPLSPARLEHDAGSQLEDADTAAIRHLLWLGIQILRIHLAEKNNSSYKNEQFTSIEKINILLMSLIRLLLVYDQQTHIFLMSDHQIALNIFMYVMNTFFIPF